jgi:hypothetical protein
MMMPSNLAVKSYLRVNTSKEFITELGGSHTALMSANSSLLLEAS